MIDSTPKHRRLNTRTFATRTLLVGALITLLACSPATEEDYVNRAKAALAENDNTTAIIEMKNVLGLNKENAEVRWLLGTTYLAQGDGASAEKELRVAMELGVDQQSSLLPLAQAYYIQRKYDDVIKLEVPQKLASNDLGAQIFTLKGRSHLALSDPFSAEKILKRAQELAPDHVDVITGMAALKAAQGRIDEALLLLSRAKTADPSYAPTWRQLAQLEQQRGNFEAAIAAYSQVIDLDATSLDLAQRALVYIQLKNIDAAKKDLAQAQKSGQHPLLLDYVAGVIAVNEGRHEDAKSSLQAVLNKTPDYMPAIFYLGLVSYQTGEIEQARALLSTFQRKHPGSASANKLLGGVYLSLGDKSSAANYLRKAIANDPDDVESIKLLGQLSLEKGASAEAIAYFTQVVEKQASNPENYILLGRSYSAAKQPNAARKEYSRAMALNPDLASAEIGIITSYINDNEFKLALDYVHKLQQERPNDTDLPVFESAIHLALGDRQAARAVLKRALVLAPGQPSLSHNLANLSLLEGDFDTARELYQEAIKHHPADVSSIMHLARLELISGYEQNALALVEKALEIDPTSLDIRSTLATYHLKQGQPKQAMALIDKVAEQYADEPSFLEIRTKIYIDLGQYQQARKSLSRLLELQPRSAEAHFLLAKVNVQLADGDRVLENLLEALRLNPRHFEARLILTRIYAKNGAFEQSDAILDSLVGIYGAHPQVLYLMGLKELRANNAEHAYELFSQAQSIEARGEYLIAMTNAQFRLGNIDDAVASLKTWMKKNPSDLTVQYHLANAFLLLQRNDDAIVEFRNALRIDPDSIGALNNLAWLLSKKSPDEAEKLANQALALAPKSPQALHTMAMIKLNQNKPGESIKLLKKAIGYNPNDYQLQYSLAKTLEENGQAEEAVSLYKDLLSKDKLPQALKTEIKSALNRQ
ncbi:MAG: PEP-CTERM system TPR-repeat protein PrsT [Gammaproteobacteria bacterium]|nr:PEP-CTERM system TPR-repeat protein PrsT [Gammaproteobacteria bacterium]MBQ0838609.1 PEP-CTERM system TPR-repeat protein PrsT [Gammaproteobacteria bacterium]